MDRTELFRATVRSSKLMRSRLTEEDDGCSTSQDGRSLHALAASLKKSATKICESKFSLMAKSIVRFSGCACAAATNYPVSNNAFSP